MKKLELTSIVSPLNVFCKPLLILVVVLCVIMLAMQMKLYSVPLSQDNIHQTNITKWWGHKTDNIVEGSKTFLVTIDTRPLIKGYWSTAALVNYLYALHHNYTYYYLIANISCINKYQCKSYYSNDIHAAWMKVKGILLLLDAYMNDNDIGIYLDSDVMINPRFFNLSILDFYLNSSLTKDIFAANDLQFDWSNNYQCNKNSFLIPNDTRTYWHRFLFDEINNSHIGYYVAINTGIIIFRKCDMVKHLVTTWWQSSNIETSLQKYTHKNYENKWPFEQERLNYIINTNLYKNHIVFQKWSLAIMKRHLFVHWAGMGDRDGLYNDVNTLIQYICNNALYFHNIIINNIVCDNATLNGFKHKQIYMHVVPF